jgi:hypothetical protein
MLDNAQFAALTKTRFTPQKVQEVLYSKSPLLAMVAKDTNFVGDSEKIPVIYGDNQNISSNFQIANGGTSAVESAAFFLTRKRKYSSGFISTETMLLSQTNEGAFLKAYETELKSMMRSISDDISFGLVSSGAGNRGQISNVNVGTSTITLSQPRDIVNIHRNMLFNVSATLTGGAVRVGTAVVATVDRKAGTFTYTGAIAGIANNDYIYRAGDYDAEISGLSAWLPYDNRAALLAASFYGVTRNVDSTRLGGWTEDFSALPIEEAIIEAAALLSDEGSNPETCLLNPLDFAGLQKALGSKVQYIQTQVAMTAMISFEGIVVQGPTGPIRVYAERHVPRGKMFLLQLDTWTLKSLGEPVRVFDMDGLQFMRSQTADGIDVRLFGYPNLACHAPGFNGQFAIQV